MIRWLTARPGPALDQRNFLCAAEVAEGQRYRHPGRYRQWLLGRAAAKVLLDKHSQAAGQAELLPGSIHIQRIDTGWPKPRYVDGGDIPVSLSISHTSDKALCALCPKAEGTLGADIEVIAPRSKHLLEDFYTSAEREYLHALESAEQARAATIIWCIKEAALKARRTGFHESATSVAVGVIDSSCEYVWKRAQVILKDGTRPEAFWRLSADSSLAMAIVRISGKQPARRPDPSS